MPAETVSPETIALIAAGGAVLGAFAGSGVAGLIDYRLELRREQRKAKAGARLVAIDLRLASSNVRIMAEGGKWYPDIAHPIGSWEPYSDALAARLSDKQFTTVSQAIYVFSVLSDKFEEADISTATGETLESAREQATKAFNALAGTAGLPRVPSGKLVGDEKTEDE